MSHSVYYPLEVSIEKLLFSPQREEHSQFSMKLTFDPNRTPFVVHGVHLPSDVVRVIENGNVHALWLDRLEPNSLASRLLPEQPDCLVTCVELKDGSVLRSVPPVLRRARNHLRVLAALLLVTATATLCTASSPIWAWGGALLLVCGVRRFQTLRGLPIKRFRAYEVVTASG